MFEISGLTKATVNIIIAAFPVLATLFFAKSQARKRNLNNLESAAVYLVFWGFLLLAFWENLRIPITNNYGYISWLSGWIVPIVLGIVISILTCTITKKERRNSKH